MANRRQQRRQLDEIIARWEPSPSVDGPDLTAYADDPDGFCNEILHADLIFDQEIAACAVRDHRRVSVRSSHGYGKDYVAAALAVWAAYARGMKVIVTSASERQVRKILISEIRTHLNRARVLPGTLYQTELRIGDEAMILGFTTNEISKATGFHSPTGVLLILSEAQGIEARHPGTTRRC